jgi:inward rectifier potassium channel
MARTQQLFNIQVERRNLPSNIWTDLYHFLIVRSWLQLLGILFAVYFLSNVVFALGYFLGGTNCIQGAHGFIDDFFFSVQTLSTIGYGTMVPHTLYAHVLVMTQAFAGTLFLAVVTGLVFSKFARPTARVLWSQNVTIIMRDGKRQLQFRMANARANQIVEAQLRVAFASTEVTSDGERLRRFADVKLQRDRNILFALSWTAVHEINDDSPLQGLTVEKMREIQMQLVCSLVGIDETFAQQVHSRHAYLPEDVVYDQRFADIVSIKNDGSRAIDYARFNDLVPMGTRTPEHG